jgi:hypothetical protein
MARNESSKQSAADRRATFVKSIAPTLAAQVGDITGHWTTGSPLSRFFGWFHAPDALVIVGCDRESQRNVDLGLAYGLAHASDRELILILPDGFEEPTRRRLPWIDAAVRLYTHDSNGVTPVPVLSRHEVLIACDDPLVTALHELGERAVLVDRLIEWADACAELVAAHRPSYLAWHCRGRMVLKVRKTRPGLIASAGVHSTVDDSQPHAEQLIEPITGEQFHRLVAATSSAVAERLGGGDAANAEHQLQELLAAHPSKLKLRVMLREFPATRPVDNRGYIDFLSVGHDHAIHVVETKIGADPMLVLQGLDYWIWTTAHLTGLVDHFNTDFNAGVGQAPRVVIDFVVAEKDGKVLSPYTAAQLEAIDGSVPWGVHQIAGWDTGDTAVHPYGRRQSPPGNRVAAPTFPVRLRDDLIARSGAPLKRRVFYPDPGGGIFEPAKPVYVELRERKALHRFVNHVQSSQAFALNVFGGLSDTEQHSVWALLGVDAADFDDVEFEYVDPLDAMSESQASRPHRTQVDVLLRCTALDGRRHVALIEVKLGETAFGECSAFKSEKNDKREVCRQDAAWGGDRESCFQLRNHDGPQRRTYDQHLQSPWITPVGVGCPFRELNQPMRNIALARAILDRGDADIATFALCAPTANTAVWRQWHLTRQIFADVPDVSLIDLNAESLVDVLSSQRAEVLKARYGFFEGPI